MELQILKTIYAIIDVVLLTNYPPQNFSAIHLTEKAVNNGVSRYSSPQIIRHSNSTSLNYTLINNRVNDAIFGLRNWWSGTPDPEADIIDSGIRRSWSNTHEKIVSLDEWISPTGKKFFDKMHRNLRKFLTSLACSFGNLLHSLPGGTFMMYHIIAAVPATWDELIEPFQNAAVFGSDCVQYDPFVKTDEVDLLETSTPETETPSAMMTPDDEDKDNLVYKRRSAILQAY